MDYSSDINALLSCLAIIAPLTLQLNRAVKERIIIEVNNKISNYTGRDSEDVAYSVTINGQELAWDSQDVSAEALFAAIPFKYERQAAANYAIARSQANFEAKNPSNEFYFASGAGNLPSSVPDGVSVGGHEITLEQFRYSTLTHEEGSTGSAYFISEMLHFGGKLPMFVCDSTNVTCNPDDLLVSDMWLVRCGGGVNLEATSAWRDHRFLMSYFVQKHKAVILTNPNNTIEERLKDTVFFQHPSNSSIQNPNTLAPNDSQFVEDDLSRYIDFENGGIWKTGFENQGKTFLTSRFNDEGLQNIDTGDYVLVFLGQDTSAHGFFIVGWGDPVDSPVGMNTKLGRNNFSIERQPNKIPYVADFAYGRRNGNYGFLQDIRPRPFYSAIASINNTQLSQQLSNLGNPSNGFIVSQISDYEARLRNNEWGRFSFSSGAFPSFQFFRFTNSSNVLSIPFRQIFEMHLPC